MKKFAICCAVLVVAALMVPGAQAQTKCLHFTNFSDGFQYTQSTVGGIQGHEWVGLWDWFGLGNGSGTLMAGSVNKIGTQPAYPYYPSTGTTYGFAANFTFKPSVAAFDLYGTFDGANAFAFQTAQPYTKTAGPCSPLGPRKPGAKSSVGR